MRMQLLPLAIELKLDTAYVYDNLIIFETAGKLECKFNMLQ